MPTNLRPHATPATDLAGQFKAAGFVEGVPPHLPQRAMRIDRGTCRRLRCGRCLKRGLDYRPFHNRHGRYRVLAVCPNCVTGDER